MRGRRRGPGPHPARPGPAGVHRPGGGRRAGGPPTRRRPPRPDPPARDGPADAGNRPALAGRLAARRPGLKVLYLSGLGAGRMAAGDPPVAFLAKPFRTADLRGGGRVARLTGPPSPADPFHRPGRGGILSPTPDAPRSPPWRPPGMTDAAAPAPSPDLVVGLGASAGGLEALQGFFAAVPPDTGLSFVVVAHLEPAGPNLVPELLGKATPCRWPRPRTAPPSPPTASYVAPARAALRLDGDILRVVPVQKPRGRTAGRLTPSSSPWPRPVRRRRSPIVLSGSGTRRHPRAEGRQRRRRADHGPGARHGPGRTGCPGTRPPSARPTASCRPTRWPDELLAYAKHVRALAAAGEGEACTSRSPTPWPASATCCWPPPTTTSSTTRPAPWSAGSAGGCRSHRLRAADAVRRAAQGRQGRGRRPVPGPAHRGDPVLPRPGGVRRPRRAGPPPALRRPPADRPGPHLGARLRRPGEEAYTLAMLVRERLDRVRHPPEVQIFATDINERALRGRPPGRLPGGDRRATCRAERLERFFLKKGDQYQVAKEVRELCLFCAAQPDPRPAVQPARPDLLPQPAHLPRAAPAEEADPALPLRPAPGRVPVPRAGRDDHRHRELFRAGGRQAPDLASGSRRPSARPCLAGRGRAVPGRRPPAGRVRPRRAGPAPGHAADRPGRVRPQERGGQRGGADRAAPPGGLEKYLADRGRDVPEQRHSSWPGRGCGSACGPPSPRRPGPAGRSSTSASALKTERASSGCVLDRPADAPARRADRAVSGRLPGRRPGRRAGAAASPAASGRRTDALIDQLERELRTTREDLEKTIQDLEAANEEMKSSNEELALDERGAPVGQRGAGDVEGGDPVGQRRPGPGQQRPGEPARRAPGSRPCSWTTTCTSGGSPRTSAAVYNLLPPGRRPAAVGPSPTRPGLCRRCRARPAAAAHAVEDEVGTADGRWYLRRGCRTGPRKGRPRAWSSRSST